MSSTLVELCKETKPEFSESLVTSRAEIGLRPQIVLMWPEEAVNSPFLPAAVPVDFIL